MRSQDLLECQRRNAAFEQENKELMAKLQVPTGTHAVLTRYSRRAHAVLTPCSRRAHAVLLGVLERPSRGTRLEERDGYSRRTHGVLTVGAQLRVLTEYSWGTGCRRTQAGRPTHSAATSANCRRYLAGTG